MAKLIKPLIFLCGCISPLLAIQVTKGGTIPSYNPYDLDPVMFFLPYNPKVLLVGDKIARLAADVARARERSTIFCFSSEEQDFTMLKEHGKLLPSIRPYFGLLYGKTDGTCLYFSTEPHERPYEDFYRFAGSMLKPIDKTRSFLFGRTYEIPKFSLSKFCERENLSKVDFIRLDSGGTELQILKSHPDLVKNAIVVSVRTYHQQLRRGISAFGTLDRFMMDCDFELMSHYIYDDVIGDALYVKRRYINAVFRIKEI